MGLKAGHILNLFNIFPALPRRTVSTLNLFTTFLFTNLFTILSVRRDLFTYTIHCLMILPLDCGGSVFGPCFVLHYLSVISSLQSSWGRERAGCFTLIVFLMSCDCWYSVFLLPNAVGWYAVSNCAISWSYSFTYCDSIFCYGIMHCPVSMPDKWFYAAASYRL